VEGVVTELRKVTGKALKEAMPAWAKAPMLAEYEIDKCDGMTDYYATATTRRVFLGWSSHTRDLFPEMRKAALKFAETASLATAPKSAEHKEKYSMGAGYYLKAEGTYSTGWSVSKGYTGMLYDETEFEVPDGVTLNTGATAVTVHDGAVTAGSGGVTMTLNAVKAGVELRFPSKPSEAVRTTLKANGWRWSRFSSCWYKRDTPEARAFAAAIVGEEAA